MYQSSSSTSSHTSTAPNGGGGGLSRYGSAPGSLLNSAVDSIIGATRDFSAVGSQPPEQPNLVGHYFTSDSSSFGSESTSRKVSSSDGQKDSGKGGSQRSYGLNEIGQNSGGGVSSSPLFRQRSSPAGFLRHLSTDHNGFSLTRANGNFNGERGTSRLNSLSRISEVDESPMNGGAASSNMSFGVVSWDDSSSSSIGFTIDQPNKRANKNPEFFALDPQFSIPHASLEMAAMDHNLLHIPEDSIACKLRAKRGCATHPRSIAERERRTRISGKLKKLQELVPNMDKQTSYSDMLDLAVDHIKGLQNQVQKLQKEKEKCTCSCKRST